MSQTATPVTEKERIGILDSLRGFAILGILLMNIPAFAYALVGSDPTLNKEAGTINYYIWQFVNWVPDGTQRALFSMLFGASILLFIGGKEKQQDGISSLDYFLRRQIWLIVFGLADVYLLLWRGDILFDYGCYGFIMVAFRNLSPKKLLLAAGLCFCLMIARENRDLYSDKKIITRGETVERLDTAVHKLNAEQKERLSAMNDFKERNKPESRLKRVERANRMMTGSYENLYEFRSNAYLSTFLYFTYFSIWDVLLFMFTGMAFFKMRILTGQASVKLYAAMCLVGLGAGLLINYYQMQPLIDAQFNRFDYTKNASFSFYEAGRTLRALGILGFIMLLYKSGGVNWLFKILRPVGQMALTNYLMQSIICAIIFYGIGFSLFGKLERYEIYLVVLGIWIVEIIWSNIWLRYFQFGPFEWAWRQLTYWKRLPILR